jgi:hypothetical protein
VKEGKASLECLFYFQFRHDACPFIMNIALCIVEAASVDIKFLIFFLLYEDVYLYLVLCRNQKKYVTQFWS